jgi:hypothetical protein
MKREEVRSWKKFLVAGAMTALVAGVLSTPPSVHAAGTIKADDDKWISVGMGLRTSFNAQENGAASGQAYSNEFAIDNARIYVNGKVHKYIGFEFNTDCFNCKTMQGAGPFVGGSQNFGGNSSIGLLDAIGKFEFNEMANLWVGRMLLPSERGSLNNAFYNAIYTSTPTPGFPAAYSQNFNGVGAGGAGLNGRDNAATFFGKIHPFGTHLLYVLSVSQGLRGGPNTGNSLMYTGRLQWNLLNDEKNPGYYTMGTYYGTMGDIVAIGVSGQHQKDGAGSVTSGTSDFTAVTVDLLVEKLLPNNMGVFTFNGEFKRFFANYGAPATANANCFCVFNGDSWSVNALYLIPQEIGIGRFQPYMRYTSIDPRYSTMRQEWEVGTNYVISGHNARVAAYYTYGDISSMLYANPQQKVDTFHVALQLQY